jgi:outer membrane protein assembly factor BamD (BamD/ComL family)
MRARGFSCLRALGAMLTCVLFAGACAPTRGDEYLAKVAAAKRAQSAGRLTEAANAYRDAAVLAKLPRDELFCMYLAGVTRISADDLDGARAQLRRVTREPYVAQAQYYLAIIDEREQHVDAAQRGFEHVVATYPAHGVARSALYRVLAYRERSQGDAATVAYLEQLEAQAPESDLIEVIAYQRGKREVRLGQLAKAKATFLAIADKFPYPKGVHFDDALALASELEEQVGAYANAIALLSRMLKEREVSSVMGTYERPRFAAAALKIAELTERSGSPSRAAEAYEAFVDVFTTSTRRDDALIDAARIYAANAQPDRACRALRKLVTLFPDSRYVPCSTDRCPTIKRPAHSKAPAICHAYLSAPRAATAGETQRD